MVHPTQIHAMKLNYEKEVKSSLFMPIWRKEAIIRVSGIRVRYLNIYKAVWCQKALKQNAALFNTNFFMQKIIGFLSLAAVLTIMSCTGKPAEVKKEVIVVPSKPVIIIKNPPEKPTTITVDKNGVKVEAKKVDVTVKKQ
jgi:hypothetical protein